MYSVLQSWLSGFKLAFTNKHLITLVYCFNLLLALVIAIPFFASVEQEAGGSLALESMLEGFDYTTYQDFQREHGDAIQVLLSQVKWMAIAYLFFSVLLSGGILQTLAQRDQSFSLRSFFEGCGRYFFRFFRLLFFVVFLQVIIALIVYVPLSAFFAINKAVELESSLFYIGLSGFLLHLTLFILVLMIGDYARISLFRNDSTRVLRSIWQSTQFVFRRFGKTYGLYLAVIVIPLALFALYFIIDAQVTMRTPLTIFLGLILQQVFVWLRIGAKVWMLGSELALHTLEQPLEEIPVVALLKVEEEPEPLATIEDIQNIEPNAIEKEPLP